MKKQREKNIVQSGTMERPIRKFIQLPVTLIINDKSYSGMIINMSSNGVGMYVDTTFQEGIINFDKTSPFKLELHSTVGDCISLNCKAKCIRIQEKLSHGLTTRIGIEIIDPPSNFTSFFQNL